VLRNELARKFDLSQVRERPLVPHGQPVQLGDKKGIVFRRSPEEEALQRWTCHDFLEVERGFAKQWRNALMRVNHDDLVRTVMAGIGHWRKPKSAEDAKEMADYIIDNMDPEWLIGFGLEMLDLPEATQFVRNDWTERRKPPIRQHLPYFTFMLSVNVFFFFRSGTSLGPRHIGHREVLDRRGKEGVRGLEPIVVNIGPTAARPRMASFQKPSETCSSNRLIYQSRVSEGAGFPQPLSSGRQARCSVLQGRYVNSPK